MCLSSAKFFFGAFSKPNGPKSKKNSRRFFKLKRRKRTFYRARPAPHKEWKRSSTQYCDWEVGDLVTLREYCANRDRPAIITELPDSLYIGGGACKIQYIDNLREPPVSALLSNLTKIDSAHEFENG